MEINLHVTQVLTPMSGTSKNSGKQWVKQEFVGETYDQYPRLVCITIFNPSDNTPVPKVGDSVTVSFDLESRSWVGKDGHERWSTEVKAWRIAPNTSGDEIGPATKQAEPLVFQQPQPQEPYAASYQQFSAPVAPGYQPQPAPTIENDLPF